MRFLISLLLLILIGFLMGVLFMQVAEHAPTLYCYSRPTFEYCYWKNYAWTQTEKFRLVASLLSILGWTTLWVLTFPTERVKLL